MIHPSLVVSSMVDCPHKTLVLVQREKRKLRCLHCHLTISPRELGQGFCPECYDRGLRHQEFEELEDSDAEKVIYQCETCPLTIEAPP